MTEEQLTDLAAACERGSRTMVYPSMVRDWFNDLLHEQLNARFIGLDVAWISQALTEGHLAIGAARNGNRDAAINHLDIARSLFRTDATAEALCLAEAFHSAQKAYLLYLDDAPVEAVSHLQRAFSNDCLLEQNSGWSVLVMHRLQLLHNRMRIDRRGGRWAEMLLLGYRLLDYLERRGGSALDCLPYPWNQNWPRSLERIPLEFSNDMHRQIAMELVRASLERVASASYGREIERIRQAVGEEDGTQVGLWLAVQQKLTSTGLAGAHSELMALLARGALPSTPLWKSAVEIAQTAFSEGNDAIAAEQ